MNKLIYTFVATRKKIVNNPFKTNCLYSVQSFLPFEKITCFQNDAIYNKSRYRFVMQSTFDRKHWYCNTVEPVYNGHPRDLRNWPLLKYRWPLNTGSRKILTGRCLMSILMAYHTKTVHARKQ